MRTRQHHIIVSMFLMAGIILASCQSVKTFAQTTEMMNGREFIVHTVKKQETLYGISRQYNIPMDTIIAYNPSAKDVIRKDEILKFPKDWDRVVVTEPVVTELQGKALYKVLAGETLYGIARKFNTTVDYLKTLNPQLGEVLQVGSSIFVPAEASTVTDPVEKNETTVKKDVLFYQRATCDSMGFSENEIHIALLLPFYGSLNSQIASEFYAGAKIGADSLSKFGKKIILHVYDTKGKNDSDQVMEVLSKPEMKDMDLVIGPLYGTNILSASQVLNDLKLPLVTPFARNEALLEGNPYVFKFSPGERTVAETLIKYFHRTYPGANYILANPGLKKDSLEHQYYKDALKKYAGNDTANYHFLSSRSGVYGSISAVKKNIVIYPCSKEITVKDFLTKFNKAGKKQDILLVGTEDWLDFSNIEADYYENLRLHVPAMNYESYTDSSNYSFMKLYQAQFGSDPGKYSFRAFHIMEYFVKALLYYGKGLDDCEKLDFDCNCTFPSYFSHPQHNSGSENQVVRMMVFQGYGYYYQFVRP